MKFNRNPGTLELEPQEQGCCAATAVSLNREPKEPMEPMRSAAEEIA